MEIGLSNLLSSEETFMLHTDINKAGNLAKMLTSRKQWCPHQGLSDSSRCLLLPKTAVKGEKRLNIYPGCSHIRRKTATQPIPCDSGLKKRELLLTAAHTAFSDTSAHKPLIGIFFPSSTRNMHSIKHIYPKTASSSDVPQRTRAFQRPTACWESVWWGC